jgi:hypothetical protein
MLTLGVGLCGGLLSGCTHAHPRSVAASERAMPPLDREEARVPVAGVPAPADPYAPFAPPELATKNAPRPQPPEDRLLPPTVALGPPADLAPESPSGANLEPVVAAKTPEDPALLAALRCFLEKRPEEAVCKLKDLDTANREALLGLLPAAARLAEGSLNQASPQEIAALVDSLERVLAPLRARAPLTIEKICFCRWIGNFGVYEPWPPEHRFRFGDPVHIYVQLRNFASTRQPTSSGASKHLIQLVSSAEICDEAGNKVWPVTLVFERKGPQANESWTLRHDYFETYTFYAPKLPPGAYVLRVQVEDHGTQPPRTVHESLDFRITNAPAAGAAGG